jgi:hypothetical protein
MNPDQFPSKYLYTIRWTQPYAGHNPFMQELWNRYEDVVERRIESGDFTEAKREIERIMKL